MRIVLNVCTNYQEENHSLMYGYFFCDLGYQCMLYYIQKTYPRCRAENCPFHPYWFIFIGIYGNAVATQIHLWFLYKFRFVNNILPVDRNAMFPASSNDLILLINPGPKLLRDFFIYPVDYRVKNIFFGVNKS